MSENNNFQKGMPLTDRQNSIIQMLDEMKKTQLEFIDQAGKRIVELSTGIFGLLLAIAAFGDKYPPDYIKNIPQIKYIILAVILFNSMAIISGLFTIQPRRYITSEHNISEMEITIKAIINYKSKWMNIASTFFFLASLAIATLLLVILLTS